MESIVKMFFSNGVLMIFLALMLGYLFGRISFGGLKFGTSGP